MMLQLRFIIAALIVLLAGCATNNIQQNCAEFQNDPGAMLLCRAENGDQQAQYLVGKVAYDAKDINTAIKWLELASQKRPHRQAIYMPSPSGQGAGSVMLYDTNNGSSGIREAQLLLSYIYRHGIGITADLKKAQKYQGMF